MKDIAIESNGLVIYCKSMRLTKSKNMIMLYGDDENYSIGCLYVDEVCLKYRYQSERCKHYKVIPKKTEEKINE
jgi:hypothetical protein